MKTSNEYLIKAINIVLDIYFNERVNFENILNKIKCKFQNTSSMTFLSTGTGRFGEISETSTLGKTESTETQTTFYYEDNKSPTWKPISDTSKSSCEDLDFENKSGVYIFERKFADRNTKFYNKRYCQIRNDGLWTVIQRRDNYTIQHNFNVSWDKYKKGFEDLHKDFWIKRTSL